MRGNIPIPELPLNEEIKFDDAMRQLVKLPPLPSGKKAKKKVWRKKQR